jgi:hypothetical protein
MEQLTDSELARAIRERGFLTISISPAKYLENRVSRLTRIFSIVQSASVENQGWDFPHINHEDPRREDDWVGQATDWRMHREIWRMAKSGQFMFLGGITNDWLDRAVPPQAPANSVFYLWEICARLLQVYEFAARLSLTDAGDDQMSIEWELGNVGGRTLEVGLTRGRFYTAQPLSSNEFKYPSRHRSPDSLAERSTLVSDPRLYSAEALVALFDQFGIDIEIEQARSIQGQFDSISSN